MENFYNAEYLSERLAAVCRERDDLKRICEKQAELNAKVAELALELDAVTAERDALLARLENKSGKRSGLGLSDKYKTVVLAMADYDMNEAQVGRLMHYRRNTIAYHCEQIFAQTGLNPKKFYDLVKLVELVKEGKDES